MALTDQTPTDGLDGLARVYELRPRPSAPVAERLAHAQLLVDMSASAVEHAAPASRAAHERVARSNVARWERMLAEANVIDVLTADELYTAWGDPA